MTGDPVDRAAEAIRDAMDAGGDFLNEPVGKAGIAALDALVEVARAAREWASAERSDDIASNARSLRAALARLEEPR